MIQQDIILEDTTLRDGEQTPGVAFSKDMKLRIFELLYNSGVRWFEVGIPAMGGEELSTMKELIWRDTDAMLISWNRGVKDEVVDSLKLGFKGVHIGLPASDVHLAGSIKKDRKWLLETAVGLIKLAKDKGAFVSISAEDVGRAEVSFLQEYAGVVAEAGADRLRLSDTIGILDFNKYADLVRQIRTVSEIDLQCHTHNDFGLAVANTIAGIMAGAKYFHVTVNGLGERAGMPDIIQVASILKNLYKVELGLDFRGLVKTSDYLKRITNTNCFPWTPAIGDNVFAHESGIHVNGMLRDKDTFEALDPREFGKQTRYVIGKHSGKATINYYLENEGYKPTADESRKCLELVRQLSIDNIGEVSVEELVKIYLEIRKAPSDSNDPCKAEIY